MATEEGEEVEQRFNEKHFEKRIFNDETNVAMCRALLDNGLYDPVASELDVPLFGKTLVFAVSQKHAARLANILNKLASDKWPEYYGQSDFAMQVTSDVSGAQQMTINFANNRLGGHVLAPEGYDSSKTRVAVTVGMMTTGYDCQDLLNVALMRPVFSPSDFVQMKGRGTRKWSFAYNDYATENFALEKSRFKFFDFFATCEYFENEFDYDEKIKLPKLGESPSLPDPEPTKVTLDGEIDLATHDEIITVNETSEGVIMKIDREGFKSAVSEDLTNNVQLATLWANGDIAAAEEFVQKNVLDKPKHYLNLDRVRKLFNVDRRITVKELLQVAFGERDSFETKDELLDSEWEKFTEIYSVDQTHYLPAKNFFKAFIVDPELREIVKSRQLGRLNQLASFDFSDYEKLNGLRVLIPRYVFDYAYQLTGL